MNQRIYFFLLIFMLQLSLQGCKKEDQNTLTVTPEIIKFQLDGNSTLMTIKTSASSWQINNSASSWLTLSATTGTDKEAVVKMTVSTRTLKLRSDTLLITAGDAKPVRLVIYQQASDYLQTLSATPEKETIKQAGESFTMTVVTDASAWTLTNDAEWLQISKTSGVKGTTVMDLNATENPGSAARSAQVTVTAEGAPVIHLTFTQKGDYYPNYNVSPLAPDASGMTSNAAELAAKIKLGWNIGNTLEAIGGETAWGNPRVSKELIDLVKNNGFNAIRIPCSWNQYMASSATAELKTQWLSRVKDVIQYCVDNDMYVLLNIHWDGGWLENNCTTDKQEEVNAMQKAFWQQIATYLRDFDEHLLFASANEPNVSTTSQMNVLMSYHQTFLDAVRATGGKNSYRVLVIQGPSTDIEKTNTMMNTLPADEVDNRMMVEVHYYTPWNFCGMTEDASWGKMFYYWGKDYHSGTDTDHNPTWGEEASVDAYFDMMKTKFTDKGIPVIIGEFGVLRRSDLTGTALALHLASRAYFLKYVTQKAIENKMLPFYWDNGAMDTNGSALFNRSNNTVFDQQALNGLLQGAAK